MNKCNIKEPDCYKAAFYFDVVPAVLGEVNVFLHLGRGGAGHIGSG